MCWHSCLLRKMVWYWALFSSKKKTFIYVDRTWTFSSFSFLFFVQVHVRQSHGLLLVPVNAVNVVWCFFSCATLAYAEVDLGCEGVWHPTSLGLELSGGLLPTTAASTDFLLPFITVNQFGEDVLICKDLWDIYQINLLLFSLSFFQVIQNGFWN